jgi:hypothetical protein
VFDAKHFRGAYQCRIARLGSLLSCSEMSPCRRGAIRFIEFDKKSGNMVKLLLFNFLGKLCLKLIHLVAKIRLNRQHARCRRR